MPYNRPGNVLVDCTHTAALTHGQLAYAASHKVVGVAVKTKEEAISAGIPARTAIAIGELFNLIVKGEVQVANGAAFVKGDPVYCTIASNVLGKTGPASATIMRVGVVTEVAGGRGVPTGLMRVNLDLKDTLL